MCKLVASEAAWHAADTCLQTHGGFGYTQEYDIERVIHMSPGALDAQPEPSPLGYSVGRWEGEALLVTTTHVDWPYFDPYGTPQSERMSYTERFELARDGEALRYTLTATDPVVFTEPFTLETLRPWTPGVEIEPYDCVPAWEDVAD